MTNAVKRPEHVALLLGLVFDRIRDGLDDPRWAGLRPSHLRILESITARGDRASDLARRLRMTKQGAGQLVATLLDRGLVEQVPDPADRRARLLVLTADGATVCRALDRALVAVERGWAGEVGEDDYATFRRVLTRIAAGPAPEQPDA